MPEWPNIAGRLAEPASVDDTHPEGLDDCLGSIGHLELLKTAAQVVLVRAAAVLQPTGDLLVGEPGSQTAKDVGAEHGALPAHPRLPGSACDYDGSRRHHRTNGSWRAP